MTLFHRIRYELALIGFSRLSNLSRLIHLITHVHPRRWPRLLLLITSSLISEPLRWWESIRHGKRIANTSIEKAPIFILGHWRSGTTHLHNLLSQDNSFGHLSMYQAVIPECSLIGGNWLRRVMAKVVPLGRPMDNMVWPLDAPQEEELALAKMCPFGFYISCLFPSATDSIVKESVLMQDTPPKMKDEIARAYRKILQIATIHTGGKRLALKNPVNTARIPFLLELFPEAKFIHIHRSPLDVYASTNHLYERLLSITSLEIPDPDRTREKILKLYEDIMAKYIRDRELIPHGQLIEVSYEALESNPIEEIRRIYEGINLDSFSQALPDLEAYVASQKTYTKNTHKLAEEDRRTVQERWRFAFEAFGYPLAEVQ